MEVVLDYDKQWTLDFCGEEATKKWHKPKKMHMCSMDDREREGSFEESH